MSNTGPYNKIMLLFVFLPLRSKLYAFVFIGSIPEAVIYTGGSSVKFLERSGNANGLA